MSVQARRETIIYPVARFNPQTGEWEGLEPPSLPRNTTANTPLTTSYQGDCRSANAVIDRGLSHGRRGRSLWGRINDAVASIGNGIADIADTMRNALRKSLTWLFWIVGAVILIAIAFKGQWIVAVIVGLVCGALYACASMIVAALVSWIVFIPVALLRFVFYNIWTLLIAIGIALGAWYNATQVLPDYTYNDDSIELAEAYPIYYCEAWVLNVRDQPDRSGNVIGVLQRGEAVTVTDLYAGEDFAAIDFGGVTAYVSRKFITTDEPQ